MHVYRGVATPDWPSVSSLSKGRMLQLLQGGRSKGMITLHSVTWRHFQNTGSGRVTSLLTNPLRLCTVFTLRGPAVWPTLLSPA